MTTADRWNLVYFCDLVHKNVLKTSQRGQEGLFLLLRAPNIDWKERSVVTSPVCGFFRHLCTRIGHFTLVDLSSVTSIGILELYRNVAGFYGWFDCRLTISTMFEVLNLHKKPNISNSLAIKYSEICQQNIQCIYYHTQSKQHSKILPTLCTSTDYSISYFASGRERACLCYTSDLTQDLTSKHSFIGNLCSRDRASSYNRSPNRTETTTKA